MAAINLMVKRYIKVLQAVPGISEEYVNLINEALVI